MSISMSEFGLAGRTSIPPQQVAYYRWLLANPRSPYHLRAMASSMLRKAGLSGMGDHLRVGPQYVMPNAAGMPVIQRGPHGMPLAKPTPGEPFRFWYQKRIDDQWLPQQRVTGVMGMGATASGIDYSAELDKIVLMAMDGKIPQANYTLSNLEKLWYNDSSALAPLERTTISEKFAKTRMEIQNAAPGALAARAAANAREAAWIAQQQGAGPIASAAPPERGRRIRDEIPWSKIALGAAGAVAVYKFSDAAARKVFG